MQVSHQRVANSKPIFCENRLHFVGFRALVRDKDESSFRRLLTQYLHRKRGLSQSKLAAGILQSPSIISEMSQGKRLSGAQAHERVVAIIGWFQQQGALETLDEATALLNAAGMSAMNERDAAEGLLIRKLSPPAEQNQRSSVGTSRPFARPPQTTPRHNFSTQLTPFIGRTEQIAQLVEQSQARRLLTLMGAGGVGKTRLALEALRQGPFLLMVPFLSRWQLSAIPTNWQGQSLMACTSKKAVPSSRCNI